MEAKLILKKTSTGFYLWRNPLDKSQELLGATVPIMNDNGVDLREYKLSLKNCQAVERGYDLDELADEYYKQFDNLPIIRYNAYTAGFQKALSILGDKKFSEEDIKKRVELVKEQFREDVDGYGRPKKIMSKLDTIHQSLQQTEWDVEIEMICPHPMDTYRCGIKYGCDGDGCNHPEQVPYLDPDGNLILKRK